MTDFSQTTDALKQSRRDYARGELTEAEVSADPFTQFDAWLALARESEDIDEANAMTVATVDPDNMPSARVVLLRGFDAQGFVFFTNYESAKGVAFEHNDGAALVFYWGPLERSVRIVGHVSKVDATESDEYFATRPFKSKLGAMVSKQSAVISGRPELEAEMDKLFAQYDEDSEVPRPSNWGGYRVVPDSFEFWNGRRSRLHDRLRYRRDRSADDNGWTLERLAP